MTREPEQLLSVRQAWELYLGSYTLREIYYMLKAGAIRGLWEERGNRRKWSVPISAIAEFQARLNSTAEQPDRRKRGARDPIASMSRNHHDGAPRVIQGEHL